MVDDSILNVTSKRTVNGVIGAWISHESQLANQYFFDKYIGIGFGLINTDRKKENSTGQNDDFYGIETINLSVGIGLRKKIFKRNSLGFLVKFNYAPYSIFKKVKSDFGNSYLTAGIGYRF